MTNLRCGRAVCLLLIFGLLALATTSWAQQHNPILEKLAKTYGLDSWDQVEAVRYSWNREITGLFKASHAWTWEPKTGQITFEGRDKEGKAVKVTYNGPTNSAASPTTSKTKFNQVLSTISIGFYSPSAFAGTPAPPSAIKVC